MKFDVGVILADQLSQPSRPIMPPDFHESQQNGFKTEIALQAGTEQFHRAAVKIKRKKVWDNMKMKIIIGAIIAVIIIIIIIMATSG